MRAQMFLIFVSFMLLACSHSGQRNELYRSQTHVAATHKPIDKGAAVSVATAEVVQSGLSPGSYSPFAVEEGDFWHVIFEPRNKEAVSAEPAYLVFKANGRVVEKEIRRIPHPKFGQNEIDGETATAIAKADAQQFQVQVESYNIRAFDERDFWHVIFTLRSNEKTLAGGGPGYLITRVGGEISARRRYQ